LDKLPFLDGMEPKVVGSLLNQLFIVSLTSVLLSESNPKFSYHA